MSRVPFPAIPRLGSQFQPPKPPWAQDQEQGPFALPPAPKINYSRGGAPASPTLTPEEESSLLGNTMGMLQWAGETLDKPGAAVRGVVSGAMGGKWGGGLLNLIPFSDTLGITDPQDRVSGRDLLEQAGVADPNKPGFNWDDPADMAGDVGGFATEIALDPLTWVTGPAGSLTKAGQTIAKGAKVAEKGADLGTALGRFGKQMASEAVEGSTLSKTPAALAQQIREGQRGLVGFKLPWQSEAAVTLGAGSEMAAKALEKAAYGKYSPLRPIRGLFSESAGGAFQGALQRANDIAWGELQKSKDAVLDLAPVMREVHDGFDDTFRSIQDYFQTMGNQSGFDEFARAALEVKGGIPQGEDLLGLLRQHAGLAPDADLSAVVADTNGLADGLHQFFDGLRNTEDTLYQRYRALGGKGDMMEDLFSEHFGRRANSAVQRLGSASEGKSGAKFAFWMRRSGELRDLPGGSETINRMSRDMGLWGKKPGEEVGKLAKMDKAEHADYLTAQLKEMGVEVPEGAKMADIQEAYLWNKHLKPAIDNWIAQNGGDAASPEALQQYQKFVDDFTHADKRQSINITKTRSGNDKFVTELLPNRTRRLVKYFKGMPDDVTSNGMFDQSVVQDWFSYTESLLGKMATIKTAHNFLGEPGVVRLASDAERGTGDVPLVKAWKDAGFDKRGLYEFVRNQPGLMEQMGTKPDEFIRNLYLQEGADKTLKAFGEIVKPKTENALVKMIDKATSFYKGALTVPWPSFHSRNLVSGFWQSWADGKISFSDLLAGYTKAYKHATANYGKEVGEGGLEYINEIVNNGILSGHGQLVDILGEEAAKRAGKVPESFIGGILSAAKAKSPSQAGEHLYSYVEFLNRAGYYEALRKSGYTPAQAMHLVERSQFNYGAMSSFEKSVMRRVAPFYSFTRKNLPYQLEKLIERPGGRTAQTVRAYTDAMQAEDGSYTPEFLREGMAVRVGGEDNAATFLKQAGIPVEDLNKLAFSGGAPDLARTGEKFAAMLHPALAWLPETWAGKQFYTGRSLKDLQSPTKEAFGEPMPFVDRLIHYTPVSRAVGEVQGVLDDRKTVLQKVANALTGLKTGNYDVDRWKLIDYQNAMKEQLAENPLVREASYYYVPDQYKTAGNAPAVEKQIRRTRGLAKAISNLKQKRERENAS